MKVEVVIDVDTEGERVRYLKLSVKAHNSKKTNCSRKERERVYK